MNPRFRTDNRSKLYIFDPMHVPIDLVTMDDVELYARILLDDFSEGELRALAGDCVAADDKNEICGGKGGGHCGDIADVERLAHWLAKQDGIASWLVANDGRVVFIDLGDGKREKYTAAYQFSSATVGIGVGRTARDEAIAELNEWNDWYM